MRSSRNFKRSSFQTSHATWFRAVVFYMHFRISCQVASPVRLFNLYTPQTGAFIEEAEHIPWVHKGQIQGWLHCRRWIVPKSSHLRRGSPWITYAAQEGVMSNIYRQWCENCTMLYEEETHCQNLHMRQGLTARLSCLSLQLSKLIGPAWRMPYTTLNCLVITSLLKVAPTHTE